MPESDNDGNATATTPIDSSELALSIIDCNDAEAQGSHNAKTLRSNDQTALLSEYALNSCMTSQDSFHHLGVQQKYL